MLIKKIWHSIILVSLIGCSTSGNLKLADYGGYSVKESSSIEVKLDPDLSYWWGPWKPDLKDRVASQLKKRFLKAGFPIADSEADINVVVERIDTGGWTGAIVITNIVIAVFQKDKELFRVSFSQHGESFTARSIFRPSKNAEQVAHLLAGKIIKKLK